MEDKSKIPRSLKTKMSINDCNKVRKDWEKFGYNITNNYREAILLARKYGNTLWADVIAKEMEALERLGVFQLYLPKNKFDKKNGWKYVPMNTIFDVKQQDLRHKAMIVVLDMSWITRITPHIHLPSNMCL